MLMATIGLVSAQSLQFEWDGQVFYDGEAVECTFDEYGYGEYIQHMQLRNLTPDDLNVIIEKELVEDLEGTMNYFCWGSCFGPEVYVSPNPVAVGANSVTEADALSFHVMYNEDIYGYVVVKYYAYDERHPDERVSIIVKFHKSGVGVDELPVSMGTAYPNPATSTVHFDYAVEGNATAVVYNLLGQEVIREELNANAGCLTLNVGDLNDGIYFCTMMVDGRSQATQKFVVKK